MRRDIELGVSLPNSLIGAYLADVFSMMFTVLRLAMLFLAILLRLEMVQEMQALRIH